MCLAESRQLKAIDQCLSAGVPRRLPCWNSGLFAVEQTKAEWLRRRQLHGHSQCHEHLNSGAKLEAMLAPSSRSESGYLEEIGHCCSDCSLWMMEDARMS